MIRYHIIQKVTDLENGCPLIWDFWERQVVAAVNGEDPSAAAKDSAGRSGEQELAHWLVGKGKNSPGCNRSFFFSFSFLLHQVLWPYSHWLYLELGGGCILSWWKRICSTKLAAFLPKSEWRTEIQNCLSNYIMHCDTSTDTLTIVFLLFNVIMQKLKNIFNSVKIFLKIIVEKSTYSCRVKKPNIPLIEKFVRKIFSRP